MNNKKNIYKNDVTKQIVFRYIKAMVIFNVGVFCLILFANWYVHLFTWSPDDPIYLKLYFIREYRIIFAGIPILVGWIWITWYYMKKTLLYLDDIISASKLLALPTDEQIILPNALKNIQDELNQFREEALRNKKAAKEAEQRKNDLIVYLAHDLKTPLTSVIGYLTLLHDERQISENIQKKYLDIALSKAERLEDLINEFFEITRFNLSNISLNYSKVNFTRMMEQLVFEFKPMLEEKNLTCLLSVESNIMLMCDVGKMQRVFDNLLRNAVNYSFEDSIIQITTRQKENQLEVTFVNHGNTIPQDRLERIFEQFFRVDASRATQSGGSGLGLAIAKEIIELHHGTIYAESENEQIIFVVTLPLS